LLTDSKGNRKLTRSALAGQLFELATYAQSRGWSAEELLRMETAKQEKLLRKRESRAATRTKSKRQRSDEDRRSFPLSLGRG